jgi:hypothetical protein
MASNIVQLRIWLRPSLTGDFDTRKSWMSFVYLTPLVIDVSAMPRYFFSVKGAVVANASGFEELPDDLAAQWRAEVTAAQLVGGALKGYVLA